MDSNLSKILHDLANSAADAAAGARSAVMNAKEVIGEKYDNVKLNMELNQLDEKQENVFSDIGRMMFLMHTGKVKDTVMTEDGPKTPQQVIDSLLLTAEQVQQEIDALYSRLAISLREENERLRESLRRLEEENEILRRAAGSQKGA